MTTTPEHQKVLFLDIETAPSLGWTWGKYEQNVIDFKKDWYLLSFAYKWSGGKVHTCALPDYRDRFLHDKEDDLSLSKDLWKLFDVADIIIAHNGDRFDIPKARTRFIAHALPPPTPFKSVDTRLLARRQFKFDSNKLDDLGRYLGVGRKRPNTGFDLWRRCMSGDRAAWREMRRYNAQDVLLLERVYLKLRSWSTNHPPIAPEGYEACPKCGSEETMKRGFVYTAQRKKQQFQCKQCAGWFSGSAVKIAAK